jgi:hypothetical protein
MKGNELLPVLIVAFARKEKVQNTVNFLISQQRSILIFVDNDISHHNPLNLDMIEYARLLSANGIAKAKIADSQLGVGRAVPAAIDWALDHHSELIILEDDCSLLNGALEFFDYMINQLDSKVRIISALSPNDFNGTLVQSANCTLAHYPLIWGWATNRESWHALWSNRKERINLIEVFTNLLLGRFKLSAFSYFKAAVVRIRLGKLEAWDAEMVYYFLLRSFKAVIPNTSLIINSGFDGVASNTKRPSDQNNEIINQPSNCELSFTLESSNFATSLTDKLIEQRIYSMRKYHIFSIFKAVLSK